MYMKLIFSGWQNEKDIGKEAFVDSLFKHQMIFLCSWHNKQPSRVQLSTEMYILPGNDLHINQNGLSSTLFCVWEWMWIPPEKKLACYGECWCGQGIKIPIDCFYNLSQLRNNRDVIPAPLLFRLVPCCHLTQIRQWRLGCGTAYLCIERGIGLSFDPLMHFRKGQADSRHLINPLLWLCQSSVGPLWRWGGGLRALANKFPHPDSPPPTLRLP